MALIWSVLHLAAVLHVHPGTHHGHGALGVSHAGHRHEGSPATLPHACAHAHSSSSTEDHDGPVGDDDDASCGLCQVLHRVPNHVFMASLAVLDTARAAESTPPRDDPAPPVPSAWLPPGRGPPTLA